MDIQALLEKAHNLPATPGVYIMKDSAQEIIYVGKAKALKNRVSSYFTNLSAHTEKTFKMVSRVDDFETVFCDTEFEALLVENTLIKHHKPKYNIMLKDGKGYPYVRLDTALYPRFSIVSAPQRDKARYFGPYGGRGSAKQAIELITATFLLPTCSRKFPKDIGKGRPCLRFHVKKCCGLCSGNVSHEQYIQLIDQAIRLLEGKGKSLEDEMQKEMERCAESLDFEAAAVLRDRLKALKRLSLNSLVTNFGTGDMDVIGYASLNARGCIALLTYNGGNLLSKRIEFFDGLEESDAGDAIASFIQQHYAALKRAPKDIYLSHEVEDAQLLSDFLSSLGQGRRVHVFTPQRGEKQKLAALAKSNAELELKTRQLNEQKSNKTLEMLKEALSLKDLPKRIEAYDISNTLGQDAVASMTVFEEGKPKKSAYKRFKIKEAAAGDDYGALAEVLGRRIDRALSREESFLPLPDVFLIDGGKGQAGAVLAVVSEKGLDVPVWGMVKDDKHRTRALTTADGVEIGLAASPQLFAFIGRIQEETHRFAITFHRDVRSKKMKSSTLDNIPGVGPARRQALLKHFKTIAGIKAATFEQLCEVVPKDTAQSVRDYFDGEGK